MKVQLIFCKLCMREHLNTFNCMRNVRPEDPVVVPGVHVTKPSLDEPAAWLHTLWYELGQSRVMITDSQESPFGVPGEDHSEWYPVTSEPLYRKTLIKKPRVRL